MKYKLVIVETAEADADEIYQYLHARSPQGARSWYRAFQSCTEQIVQQPFACAIARESAELPMALRQAMFKTRGGNAYRCVFTVVENEVRLLRVRGRGQPLLGKADIPGST